MSTNFASAGLTRQPMLFQPAQALRLMAYGTALWFLAALAVRYGTPAGLFTGPAGIVTYVATFALTYAHAWAGRRMPHIGPGRLLSATAIATFPALLLDGIAVVWMPGLYGPDAAAMLPGLAWVFAGAGGFLLFAVMLDRD